jgi:hypothetical protein
MNTDTTTLQEKINKFIEKNPNALKDIPYPVKHFKGHTPVRLKIKKENHKYATTDGFVYYDVEPGKNPFEIAKQIGENLNKELHPDWLEVYAIRNANGIILNWNGVESGDEVQVLVMELSRNPGILSDTDLILIHPNGIEEKLIEEMIKTFKNDKVE